MTEGTGKISVIMPIYRAEKYLEEAIESVLKQDYQNWELLLVVTKSEDGSLEIAKKYAEEHGQVRLIENEEIGAGRARNFGMKESDGEYIVFIDADDYLADASLFSRCMNLAKNIPSDIFISNYARLWDGRILPAMSHNTFSGYPRNSEEFRFRGFFSTGTLSYVWGRMYRRSFLEQHDITFSDHAYAEDKLFNMKCYVCGAAYTFLEEIGYIYRKNEDSISYQYNPKMSECWIDICKKFREWVVEQGKMDERYERLIWYTLSFAVFFNAKMEYEQHKKSLRSIRRILKKYRKDDFVKEYLQKFSMGKKEKKTEKKKWKERKKDKKNKRSRNKDEIRNKDKVGLEQKKWKIFLKGFTWAIYLKCYLLLSIGIKFMIQHRIDERLSDTGLRE